MELSPSCCSRIYSSNSSYFPGLNSVPCLVRQLWPIKMTRNLGCRQSFLGYSAMSAGCRSVSAAAERRRRGSTSVHRLRAKNVNLLIIRTQAAARSDNEWTAGRACVDSYLHRPFSDPKIYRNLSPVWQLCSAAIPRERKANFLLRPSKTFYAISSYLAIQG